MRAGSDFGLQLVKFRVSTNGITATNPPGVVRLFSCTFATNPPTGTNNTSATPIQTSGRTLAHGCTAAVNWTTGNEPTVKTYIDEFALTPNGGTLLYDYPLGTEPDTPALNSGFGIEVTFSVAVGISAALWFTRI